MHRQSSIVVAVVFVLMLSAATSGCSGRADASSANPTVYVDRVNNPWQSRLYSWDILANYEASGGHPGRCISVDYRPWGGLALFTRTPLLITTNLVALQFDVRGERGGELLRVALYDRSNAELPRRGGLKLAELDVKVTTSWQRVRVPLTRFGVNPGARISKLAFMSDVAGTQTVRFDSISFVGAQ